MTLLKILSFLFLFCQASIANLDTPPMDTNDPTSSYQGQEVLSSPSIPKAKATLYQRDRRPSSEAVIAAIVNGTPITVKDLKNKLKLVLKVTLESLPPPAQEQVKRQVLNILIDEMIKIQTTENLGLKVEKKEIESAIQHIEKQNNFPKGRFLQMLKEKKIPENLFHNSIKADLLWRQYISALAGNSLEIDKKELKEIIDVPQISNIQYHLAEIEIYTPEDGSDEESLKKITKIVEELKSKKPFMMIAHTQSHAPSSARGGDIGWINQEIIDEEELEVIKNLNPGQVTMPIKTNQGYKIILLIDKRDMSTLQPVLTARQLEIKVTDAISRDQKTLSDQMKKFEKLVQSVNNCSEFDQLIDQIPNAQMHVYKEVSLSELSPDLSSALNNLDVGVASQAIFNSSNNTIVFFLVCEKSEAPRAKIRSAEGIATQVSNQRFMSISEQKLREAKRVASIEIRI